jgi:CheY-like chemotaxis protein
MSQSIFGMSESKPTILLVEDNEEDAFLLRRALRRETIDCAVQVAEDGQEAIEYLGGTGKYADRTQHPFPSLVLLDLKLPYVHGFEVLAWVATQPACKDLRIIILTSSGEDRDREKAEQFGIRMYFTKPPTTELVTAVKKVLQEVCIGSEATK